MVTSKTVGRLLHDRFKDLGPMIERANGGSVSIVSTDGWTQGPQD
jgi:hypothetical protein